MSTNTGFAPQYVTALTDATNVIDGTMVKVSGWYDNEWGYSVRCVDLLRLVGARLGAAGRRPFAHHEGGRDGVERPGAVEVAREHVDEPFVPQLEARVHDAERGDGDAIGIEPRVAARAHVDRRGRAGREERDTGSRGQLRQQHGRTPLIRAPVASEVPVTLQELHRQEPEGFLFHRPLIGDRIGVRSKSSFLEQLNRKNSLVEPLRKAFRVGNRMVRTVRMAVEDPDDPGI